MYSKWKSFTGTTFSRFTRLLISFKTRKPIRYVNSVLPNFLLMFFEFFLVLVRLLSVFYAPIDDCDEVFNYWEPLKMQHLGPPALQTWEYSPSYALRSYAYTGVYSLFLFLLHLPQGPLMFYAVRLLNVGLFTTSELLFSSSFKHLLGFGRVYLLVSALSVGLFQATPAFLPSSTCMILSVFVWFFWKRGNDSTAILLSLVSVLITAWPFASVIYVGFAVDVVSRRGFVWTSTVGLFWLSFVCLLILCVDSYNYGRVVFPPFNIAVYNFGFTDKNLASLYGVEPWYFYILNLFLNFGPILLFACFGCISSFREHRKHFKVMIAPAILWFLVMSYVPHKEERFLYPIYPVIVFTASLFLNKIRRKWLFVTVIFLSILVSISRVTALVKFYGGVGSLWSDSFKTFNGNSTVCMQDDWYRFYSSYFLPEKTRLAFIKGSFNGQLPLEYKRHTWDNREGEFNMLNFENMNAYTDEFECGWFYLVEQITVSFRLHRESLF
jgi:alpha-1,2-mannosyltransferase